MAERQTLVCRCLSITVSATHLDCSDLPNPTHSLNKDARRHRPRSKAADRSVRSALLQFALEVVFDQVEEVIAIVGAADAVGLVGIDHEAELLVCID